VYDERASRGLAQGSGLPHEDDHTRPLSRWMRGTTLVLLGVLMRLLPAVEAAQGTQGLQDGWAVCDQGQITAGNCSPMTSATCSRRAPGWVRVKFRWK